MNGNELLFGDVQMFDLFRLEMAFYWNLRVKRGWVSTGWDWGSKGQINLLSRLMNRSVKKVGRGKGWKLLGWKLNGIEIEDKNFWHVILIVEDWKVKGFKLCLLLEVVDKRWTENKFQTKSDHFAWNLWQKFWFYSVIGFLTQLERWGLRGSKGTVMLENQNF